MDNVPNREIDIIIGGLYVGEKSRNTQRDYVREANDPPND